jgi:hypothetical protein
MTHQETREFWKSQDWTLCDAELARRTGRKKKSVTAARNRLAIPCGKLGRRKGGETAGINHHARKAWLTADDFTAHDAEMARRHGLTRERIRQVRASLALPPSNFYGRRKSAA